jgi:parvulin-like peptidyl-prolyl isomerase
MIAKVCGRGYVLFAFGLAAAIVGAGRPALAQDDVDQKFKVPPPAPRTTAPGPDTKGKKTVRLSELPDGPALQLTQIPVNPTDAILKVNGQIITRQQLADECIARKGKEIAELLIHRTLVEQALRAKKLEVTATEIDQEIEAVAGRFKISREGWLRTLDKERGISPMQYARDIIYPAIALRKLCTGRVQVTPNDMKQAFEAQYAEKIHCRMILVDTQAKAISVWERLRENPAGFEKIAMDESMDTASRSLGGLLADPITRHAYPQTISNAAFQQLVDGDAADRDPSHKPKDGSITGPIQVNESIWIVLRRESLDPADTRFDLKDEAVRKRTYEMIYEVKLKETMGMVMQELIKASEIENQLTGTVKLANEEKHSEYAVQDDVKLMSNPPQTKSAPDRGTSPAASAAAQAKMAKTPPVGLSPEALREFEKINRPKKQTPAGPENAVTAAPAASAAPN